MKELKTFLLWVGLFVSPLLVSFWLGFIAGFYESSEGTGGLLGFVFTLTFQIFVYGFLASKVEYRWRDTLFQFIPIYGIFWTFRICYRTIERWTSQITY